MAHKKKREHARGFTWVGYSPIFEKNKKERLAQSETKHKKRYIEQKQFDFI